ncbi:restriction endonuclease [Selenomonas ruminis]|uniref:Restriction endonuclease n=1 Tax=Selenomonas ruminis TaxID=2593411 RepID=A0A5D6W4W7_9FIRM|nr:restriction endonuclease [Selenomonas sp. mPRGC5]TYZ22957.1 restriction endonuclease [Selenomonas sp. mPRGC5]
MTMPKHWELHRPILEHIQDDGEYTTKDIRVFVINHFSLTESEATEMLPSGRQARLVNRILWAKQYLKKAGLIEKSRNYFKITALGKEAIKDGPQILDNDYLMKYDSFKAFVNGSNDKDKHREKTDNEFSSTDNPDDTFEQAFQEINDSLAETILEEVMKISPVKFEQMVIDLLSKMGYGAFENAGKVTNVSNDEGIDGIIREDKLGFSLIYVQAKRWEVNKVVGRPEIQAFVGAISGKDGRGLFVTTARFSKQAIDFANQRHIILIDGMRLAKLMIEHNFGVTTKQVFEIKALDTDLFNEYQDE